MYDVKMVYIDRTHLLLISSRLERFKQVKEDLYNFRCVYCGDSKKSQVKARGYVYRIDNHYNFICHNCNVSTTFGKLLEFINPEQYREYMMEKFSKPKEEEETPVFLNEGRKPISSRNISEFADTSIVTLPDNHYAKEYIIDRKIPIEFHNEFIYADNFKLWMDKNFPDHGKKNVPDDPRIVMFYTDIDGTITNVAGRALRDNSIRYMTIKIRDDMKKIFGMHRLNVDKTVYITEGQIDSLFFKNGVAAGDANLNGLGDYLQKVYSADVILIWDNTPRNRDVVRQMDIAVKEDFKVVMLPYDEDAKDINEMILGGMTQEEIKNLFDEHTYQGLRAKLKLKEWRRC
jgi:transcription elongation factor Elf1